MLSPGEVEGLSRGDSDQKDGGQAGAHQSSKSHFYKKLFILKVLVRSTFTLLLDQPAEAYSGEHLKSRERLLVSDVHAVAGIPVSGRLPGGFHSPANTTMLAACSCVPPGHTQPHREHWQAVNSHEALLRLGEGST